MNIDYDRLEWELSNMGVEEETMMQLVALQKHMALKSESLASSLERVFRIAISDLYKDVFLKGEK